MESYKRKRNAINRLHSRPPEQKEQEDFLLACGLDRNEVKLFRCRFVWPGR